MLFQIVDANGKVELVDSNTRLFSAHISLTNYFRVWLYSHRLVRFQALFRDVTGKCAMFPELKSELNLQLFRIFALFDFIELLISILFNFASQISCEQEPSIYVSFFYFRHVLCPTKKSSFISLLVN